MIVKVNGWQLDAAAFWTALPTIISNVALVMVFVQTPDVCMEDPIHPLACTQFGHVFGWQAAKLFQEVAQAIVLVGNIVLTLTGKLVIPNRRSTDPPGEVHTSP